MPPAIWPAGFEPELDTDPDEARDLLDGAGYADRSELGTIVVNGSGLGVEPAVETWREELGVDIDVENMAFGDFLELVDERPPHVFTVSWIADYTSPHALYGLLLDTGAASNWGDWRDPAFVRAPRGRGRRAGRRDRPRVRRGGGLRRGAGAGHPVGLWRDLVAGHHGLRGLGNLTVGLIDFGRVSWDG